MKDCINSLRAMTIAVIVMRPALVTAQQSTVRRGVGDTSIFAPLEVVPAPNVYRSASGAPGPKYWQNRADYELHATLDTAQNMVRGTMTLRYTNNAPDTLDFLWVQTEQNTFRPNSLNSLVFPQNNPFDTRDVTDGEMMDQFTEVVAGKRVPLTLRDHETVTKVDLAHPLAPGQTATFEAAWHFLVPEHGADRMGHDGSLYEIAQWYPRVCVYDDVRGWNTDPYLGQGEFYLEYGDFTLSVTVPAGYLVAATGTLANPRAVLTSTEITRLAEAVKSDTPIPIVTAAELASGAARPKTTGMLTWRFRAHNVRDAVWAASPDYRWDASGWHGILAQSYYRSSASLWRKGEAADQARMSIQEYSERWFPYPYPQVSVVEGPVGGMEYPMLAMVGAGNDRPMLYRTLTHEVGHNWFPMLVGSNERLHAWMDEGFNAFINTFSEARRYPEQGDQRQYADSKLQRVQQLQQSHQASPIELPADRMSLLQLAVEEYGQTMLGLQLLRQKILGPAAFDDAFRTYIQRWAFKHPTPADFFRTMENVAGRRLDWFWREWFLETTRFDQAIDSVITRVQGDTMDVAVQYGNHARGVLPLDVRFTFRDSTMEDLHYPAEVWSTNSVRYVRHYAFPGKRVVRIELDPAHELVDLDRTNNVWQAP
ncbi:MAG TPA: M1 family metallopeptidase [Gemmatimonadaceae bacterium]|nr:M1 family metallopeptidase [Gemmatimonadaceae bacterium]